MLNKQRQERAEHDRERIRLLTADPFDPEAQRLIAEEIRQEAMISVIDAHVYIQSICICDSVVRATGPSELGP